MTHLSVNVNKIATVRNTRHVGYPDLVRLSSIALDAGAIGITVHPRPDERHIRASDIEPLARLCAARGREYNIEGNPFEGHYLDHCRSVRPTQCTLVPDTLMQSTSDHGWDLLRDFDRVVPIVRELRGLGCRVSLFMDPDESQMEFAAKTGAERVELYTEPYAAAFARGAFDRAVEPYVRAARRATQLGLRLNAGHDLTLDNLGPLLDAIPQIEEVSIGHALISDALELGLAEAVRRYVAICHRKR